MYDKEYRVNSYHSQYIERLADGFVTVAKDLDGNSEAFKHETLPIYGMIWHPERMDETIVLDEVKKLLN